MPGPGKYKDSLNLPSTEVPMRARLAEREPAMLARWNQMRLYEAILAARADAQPFILHGGPPYASGNIHYGHVLGKVLGDILIKYRTMAGFRSPLMPGWDTHGLPIERAVMSELGDAAATLSTLELRAACRDYALRQVDRQRQELRRLGCFGAWDEPSLTLAPEYEAAVVRALAAFARSGHLYRGDMPVYWCPRDRTALAEAEIEHHELISPSIYVRLVLAADFHPAALDPRLAGKSIAMAVWTTTPWTLPANLAVVLSRAIAYVAVPSPKRPGEYVLVAESRAPALLAAMGIAEPLAGKHAWIPITPERLERIVGAAYEHPFMPRRNHGDFRVFFADHVDVEQGTGLVHIAPGHGTDDYATGLAHGLEPFAPVDGHGRLTKQVPMWQGLTTDEASPAIIAHLAASGHLLGDPEATIRHRHPHCWRCQGPVIFRATPQWFLRVDHVGQVGHTGHAGRARPARQTEHMGLLGLRHRALQEIDAATWIPAWGRGRISNMVANRPDWCLSRQRIWGVPIPAFYCAGCGEVLAQARLMEHVAGIFAEEGADAWYTRAPADLVPPGTVCPRCGGSELTLEQDILDVWFESGCSWLALTTADPGMGNIDVYVGGSDQHRGWFHSSLLIGIGVAGRPPYRTVITHGWVVDENGRPYSKSEIARTRSERQDAGYIGPSELIAEHGAELLRMWVAAADCSDDVTFSPSVLRGLGDWYRKLRNSCRFMLGNLADFDPDQHHLDSARLSALDRYILARLGDTAARVRAAYDSAEIHTVHRALVELLSGELLVTYLDALKDRLYAEPSDAPGRRAAQVVLYTLLRSVVTMSAPILCFTAEELWLHMPRRAGDPASVHLAHMPQGKHLAADSDLARLFATLFGYRERVTRALEGFRARKHRSLDARVVIAPLAADRPVLAVYRAELEELLIVSEVVLADNDAAGAEPEISVEEHGGLLCERCRKWYRQLSSTHPDLCIRCSGAIAAINP